VSLGARPLLCTIFNPFAYDRDWANGTITRTGPDGVEAFTQLDVAGRVQSFRRGPVGRRKLLPRQHLVTAPNGGPGLSRRGKLACQDSNLEPSDPESDVLPIELQANQEVPIGARFVSAVKGARAPVFPRRISQDCHSPAPTPDDLPTVCRRSGSPSRSVGSHPGPLRQNLPILPLHEQQRTTAHVQRAPCHLRSTTPTHPPQRPPASSAIAVPLPAPDDQAVPKAR
jgi:hypothetical protein